MKEAGKRWINQIRNNDLSEKDRVEEMKSGESMHKKTSFRGRRWTALLAVILILALTAVGANAGMKSGIAASAGSKAAAAQTEEKDADTAQSDTREKDSDWVTFLLLCNEGMNNTGSNVGNTLMGVSMNSKTGKVRLMMLTWDTFVEYEGYDIPQVIDMAYRNNGPEEAVKVVNANFDLDIDRFMSLNFMNLAGLIDAYGGVDVDLTRAERNALNGLVASKKRELQSRAGENILTQAMLDMLEQEYHLSEFGPDTHLNGLQAVAYGWLQYDSVYNCCEREVEVIASLFDALGKEISNEIAFYTDETGEPDTNDGRRAINLDNITEDDRAFLLTSLAPVTQESYNNLTEDEISDMALAFARIAYMASREGVDIFENLDRAIFPLEVKEPYDNVAGVEGHLIDYAKNGEEMKAFLYKEDE